MAAKTLEAKFEVEMEAAKLGIDVLLLGLDCNPVGERFDWIIGRLQDARDLNRKIETKQRRKAQKEATS